MRRKTPLTIALLGALSVAAVALALAGRGPPSPPERSASERPALLLLSSLPIVFRETFALDGGGSPALTRLETRYIVSPIALADRRSLRSAAVLFAAHPRAQPAEVLVELDGWVRRGGRLLLLADPALEWRSERPMGDPLRPPPTFADTGLLAHWGLRLDAPEERGPVSRRIAGRAVRTVSPGSLHALDHRCAVMADGLVARCAIGKGRVTVVADADLLDLAGVEGADQSGNLDFLLAELGSLETR